MEAREIKPDGRHFRAERHRAQIVEAMVELMRETSAVPGADSIVRDSLQLALSSSAWAFFRFECGRSVKHSRAVVLHNGGIFQLQVSSEEIDPGQEHPRLAAAPVDSDLLTT